MSRNTLEDAPVLPDPRTTRFNICHVWINPHSATFDRVIAQLKGAFGDLGYECSVKVNEAVRGAVNIVVGSIVYAWPHRAHVMPNALGVGYVLYQFAPLADGISALRTVPTYVEAFAQAAAIWEHSRLGMEYFKASPWAEKAFFLPPAFHRALETFAPAPEPKTDVLSLGTPSPRRTRIVEQLGARGVKAVTFFGEYGERLNAEIGNARIVLNTHRWDESNMLEWLPIAHMLANRSFVISEIPDHNPFDDGVVYARYEDLAETCIAYLGPKAHERSAIAGKGYAAVRRCDMVANLREAIARLPIAELTALP